MVGYRRKGSKEFVNVKTRGKWIKENKDFIHSLPHFHKLILLVLYINGSLTNLKKHLEALHFTYAHGSRVMKLLEQIGFINIYPIGQASRYVITKKGENFVRVYLDMMK